MLHRPFPQIFLRSRSCHHSVKEFCLGVKSLPAIRAFERVHSSLSGHDVQLCVAVRTRVVSRHQRPNLRYLLAHVITSLLFSGFLNPSPHDIASCRNDSLFRSAADRRADAKRCAGNIGGTVHSARAEDEEGRGRGRRPSGRGLGGGVHHQHFLSSQHRLKYPICILPHEVYLV